MAIINAESLQAKSDQLNAVDLTQTTTFRISKVDVNQQVKEQGVSVHFEGYEGRPWKPSLGMRRVLCSFWGNETDEWIGRVVSLYNDTNVLWAGKRVGGIRILAMSDIGDKPREYVNVVSKQKRSLETINPLASDTQAPKQFLLPQWEADLGEAESSEAVTSILKTVRAEFGENAMMQLKDAAESARARIGG